MALEGKYLGKYRLLRLIARGGMGEVYLAEDAHIDQKVAIKVSKTDAASNPSNESAKEALRLFRKEANAIARLDHPRILPLYFYGEEHIDGMILPYIVMPYRPEGTFANWLSKRRSEGLLPIEDVIYFIHQAADALQDAHDKGIVHKDVKPENFLIRSNKEHPNAPDLLLADFGIVKLNTATESTSQNIRGTGPYMPPEQWGGKPVPASDQYALAVLAYNLLTGRLPFSEQHKPFMYQHIFDLPQPPGNLNSDLPEGIDAVILRALEKDPIKRFPSIADFAKALQQATGSNEDGPIPEQEGVSPTQQHLNSDLVPTEPNHPISTLKPPLTTSGDTQRQSFSSMKTPLLIGLVLLILFGSVGYFYIRGTTSTTGSHASSATSSQTVPYPPPNATLVINDPLSNNSKGNNWEEATATPQQNAVSVCQFTGGVYEVKELDNKPNRITYCLARSTDKRIHNKFVYEVQITIVQGDTGGLRFRDDGGGKSYYFGCRADGQYTLAYYGDNAPDTRIVLLQGSACHSGFNQPNLLAVKVQGGNVSLYINRQLVNHTDIGTYGGGSISVFAFDETNPTVVNFSNAKVWLF